MNHDEFHKMKREGSQKRLSQIKKNLNLEDRGKYQILIKVEKFKCSCNYVNLSNSLSQKPF